MQYSFKEISKILDVKPVIRLDYYKIQHVCIDSRVVVNPENTIFIALKGTRDGHDFIKNAYKAGIRYFLVSNDSPVLNSSDVNYIVVKDTLKALQELATYHRSKFKIPILAITGSNGKTICKEWISALLFKKYNVCKSPKSYNSQIGVPLSILQLNSDHEIGVFEVGISQKGEMKVMQKMLQPTFGLFTNLGDAHDNGFIDRETKLAEKIKLFKDATMIINSADDVSWVPTVLNQEFNSKSISWSSQENPADLNIFKITNGKTTTLLLGSKKYVLPFTDDIHVYNATHALVVAKYLSVETEDYQHIFQDIPLRLSIEHGYRDSVVINDTYSLDISSLTMALQFQKVNHQEKKKTVIICDFLDNKVSKKSIVKLFEEHHIDTIIHVGNQFKKDTFDYHFSTTEQCLEALPTLPLQGSSILIKGARIFQFDKIAEKLIAKKHDTTLEINLSAVAHNLDVYRQQLLPKTKIMAMVKASAYGSGSIEIARLLEQKQIDYLCVAYVDEGVELRNLGIVTPIMVLNVSVEQLPTLIQYQLEPEVYRIELLIAVQQFLQFEIAEPLAVHLKLNTGMNRLGIDLNEVDQLVKLLDSKYVVVKSIFTHLSSTDDADDDDFTKLQIETFTNMCNKISIPAMRHALNTAGIARFQPYQMDMVRLGIGLYGIDPSDVIQNQLEVVGRLKCRISQIKKYPAGTTVGYNRKGVLSRESIIATIKIGYADGLPRYLSQGVGSLWVNGQLAPIMGNICMDMTMIDITDIPNVSPGDVVEIFGTNRSIKTLANQANTIPYEILTGIGNRVKRIFYQE